MELSIKTIKEESSSTEETIPTKEETIAPISKIEEPVVETPELQETTINTEASEDVVEEILPEIVLPKQETSLKQKEKIEPKELKIDKNIDKRTQELLRKAFKNKPLDADELPIDSIIYPQPSEYLPTNYIPSKPRLREINTDDTYNAF